MIRFWCTIRSSWAPVNWSNVAPTLLWFQSYSTLEIKEFWAKFLQVNLQATNMLHPRVVAGFKWCWALHRGFNLQGMQKELVMGMLQTNHILTLLWSTTSPKDQISSMFREIELGSFVVIVYHHPITSSHWNQCTKWYLFVKGFYSPCRRGAHHLSPPNYGGGSLDLVIWVPQSHVGGCHVRYLQRTSG